MSYSDQIQRWEKFAKGIGIGKVNRRPPIDWALHRLGANVKPILFWNFVTTWIVMGLLFGVVMALLFTQPIWFGNSHDRCDALITCLLAGVVFGFWVSWKYRRIRLKYNIPPWSDFEKDG